MVKVVASRLQALKTHGPEPPPVQLVRSNGEQCEIAFLSKPLDRDIIVPSACTFPMLFRFSLQKGLVTYRFWPLLRQEKSLFSGAICSVIGPMTASSLLRMCRETRSSFLSQLLCCGVVDCPLPMAQLDRSASSQGPPNTI